MPEPVQPSQLRSPDVALPLSGVRVLDLTSAMAGPCATRVLADFGAEVIRLESRVHPDQSRLSGPFFGGARDLDRSAHFAAFNAGKLSMGLNLKHPDAPGLMRKLVEVSDVIVEAFTPGVIDRLGFGYPVLSSWNRRIVMASHSLQGQTGPRAAQRGFGSLVTASSGLFDLTGDAADPPVGPFSAYTDFIAWPILVASILLALEVREVSGEGTYIDQSHVESTAYFMAPELVAVQHGTNVERAGNHESYASPSNVYPCRGRDAWCAVSVLSEEQWHALCETLGAPQLREDARFASLQSRKTSEEALDATIAAITRGWDEHELVEALVAAGVPAGIVYQLADLSNDEQLAHRGFFCDVSDPRNGQHHVMTAPFKIGDVPAFPRRSAPALGEHTRFVCHNVLGLTEVEVDALLTRGVIEDECR